MIDVILMVSPNSVSVISNATIVGMPRGNQCVPERHPYRMEVISKQQPQFVSRTLNFNGIPPNINILHERKINF